MNFIYTEVLNNSQRLKNSLYRQKIGLKKIHVHVPFKDITSLQSLFLMMAQIPVLYSSQIYIAKYLLIALPQKLSFLLRQRRRGIVSTNQSLFCLPAKICYHDRIWLLEVKKPLK